jgi:hypothetical protein
MTIIYCNMEVTGDFDNSGFGKPVVAKSSLEYI